MTQRAASRPAVVATASPVGSPLPYLLARNWRHSARMSGPPLRWIAPSTPPPPSNEELAALTTASPYCSVMSPRTTVSCVIRACCHDARACSVLDHGGPRVGQDAPRAGGTADRV